MGEVAIETSTDSDDEWYSQMEQAAFALNSDEQIQQDEQCVDSSSPITETEDEYYERINNTNCAVSDCTFQSEKSSVWSNLMQYTLKSQQDVIDSKKHEYNELTKLYHGNVVAIQSICSFLYGNLPKSSNVYEIVSEFSCNLQSEAAIFVDHLVHPSIVVAIYINSSSNCLEVALCSSIIGNEINFLPLTRLMTQIMTENSLSDLQFSSIEGGLYDAFKAYNTTMDEIWTERCDLYANLDLVRRNGADLPSLYSFSELSESDADVINSNWKYATEHSIHMVKNMIDTYVCLGIRYTSSTSSCNKSSVGSSQLVAWCLTYRYGALGMLFTLEEHRKKGLAVAVVRELICRSRALSDRSPQNGLRSSGAPPFCYIEGSNEASKAVFCNQLGFTRQANVLWVGLKHKSSLKGVSHI